MDIDNEYTKLANQEFESFKSFKPIDRFEVTEEQWDVCRSSSECVIGIMAGNTYGENTTFVSSKNLFRNLEFNKTNLFNSIFILRMI